MTHDFYGRRDVDLAPVVHEAFPECASVAPLETGFDEPASSPTHSMGIGGCMEMSLDDMEDQVGSEPKSQACAWDADICADFIMKLHLASACEDVDLRTCDLFNHLVSCMVDHPSVEGFFMNSVSIDLSNAQIFRNMLTEIHEILVDVLERAVVGEDGAAENRLTICMIDLARTASTLGNRFYLDKNREYANQWRKDPSASRSEVRLRSRRAAPLIAVTPTSGASRAHPSQVVQTMRPSMESRNIHQCYAGADKMNDNMKEGLSRMSSLIQSNNSELDSFLASAAPGLSHMMTALMVSHMFDSQRLRVCNAISERFYGCTSDEEHIYGQAEKVACIFDTKDDADKTVRLVKTMCLLCSMALQQVIFEVKQKYGVNATDRVIEHPVGKEVFVSVLVHSRLRLPAPCN